MGREDLLNLAFATKLVGSRDFSSWVISRTKFAQYGERVRLLDQEQALVRQAKFWWRHWWCNVPDLRAESETDIFAVFEIAETGLHFALHFENKLVTSTFLDNQAESYAIRARYMLNDTKSALLHCSDFDTAILAPISFRSNNRAKCNHFGCYISHEAISEFVPEFRQ